MDVRLLKERDYYRERFQKYRRLLREANRGLERQSKVLALMASKAHELSRENLELRRKVNRRKE